ncbi:MAG: ABC transporter substrate-binding protein [Acidobacteria bacterium]|nr:ABC transporter substrate-binding protein [Acidobacteriota bacterium]
MAARILSLVLVWALTAFAAQPPQRIISAAPSVTEMLYALGLGDRVVGVTTFCHNPPEAREKPKIGDYLRPNVEMIVAMRPDLVVALAEHGELIPQLERLGLKVLPLRHNNLEGVYRSLEELAEATGVPERGTALVTKIRADLEAVRARARGLERRKTIFIVGRTPGAIQDLMAVGQGPFLNELIEAAGGVNLFAEAGQFYPRIPREEILAGRPDVILDMGDMAVTDAVTEEHKRAVAALWKREFPDLPATRAGRAYAVADDRFVVPGPRVAEAAALLFRLIHPEAAGTEAGR